MDVQFNTGRLYTHEGQVIRAQVQDQAVRFTDFSRGIAGLIKDVPPAWATTPESFARWVMGKYDHHTYTLAPPLERGASTLIWRI